MEDQYNFNKKQILYSTGSKQITKISSFDYLLKTHRHPLVFHWFISLLTIAAKEVSVVHISIVLLFLAGPVRGDK